MIKYLITFSLFLFATYAISSDCTNCSVHSVGCSYLHDGIESCNVVLVNEIANKPSCATGGNSNRYTIDITKDAGKAMMSLAAAAAASGKTLTIYGTGRCDVGAGYESANLIYLNH